MNLRSILPSSFVFFSCFVGLSNPAAGQDNCDFGFEITQQSSALQAIMVGDDGVAIAGESRLLIDGQLKQGFWESINNAETDLLDRAKFIGRLQVCVKTPDGQPRDVKNSRSTIREVPSPLTTTCTATLLPNNQVLTNRHCFFDNPLTDAGFEVHSARINFLYRDRDTEQTVETFEISTDVLKSDVLTDSLLLAVQSGDANAVLGGHFPLNAKRSAIPKESLVMIHHPLGDPQQLSSGTCRIHRRQSEILEHVTILRHSCESTTGSSGSLLLDANDYSIIGLHNQGGLSATDGTFNGGHKIKDVATGLGLDFIFDDIAPSLQSAQPAREGLEQQECINCPGMRLISSMEDMDWKRDGMTEFWAGITEVTVAQFNQFVRETNYPVSQGCYRLTDGTWNLQQNASWLRPSFLQSEDDPVVCVNNDDAMAYIQWLNTKSNKGFYRLPTTQEWEFLAAATTNTLYPWGNRASHPDQCLYANGADLQTVARRAAVAQCEDGFPNRTAPVASFLPNGFGLYDTIGNVNEWTSDTFQGDDCALGDACIKQRTRGGSWYTDPAAMNFTQSSFEIPSNRDIYLGFRVVKVQ